MIKEGPRYEDGGIDGLFFFSFAAVVIHAWEAFHVMVVQHR